MSKTTWKQVGTVFGFIMLFLCINLIAIFLFSPGQGTKIYGTETPIVHLFGNHTLTKEQLFYEFNIMLKYLTIIPSVFMFLVATNPSEFAASLCRVGVSYNISYAVAIALRYIPDVQDDFRKIKMPRKQGGLRCLKRHPLWIVSGIWQQSFSRWFFPVWIALMCQQRHGVTRIWQT